MRPAAGLPIPLRPGQSPGEPEALYPVAYVLQDFLTVASRVVHTCAGPVRLPRANTGAETLRASLIALRSACHLAAHRCP